MISHYSNLKNDQSIKVLAVSHMYPRSERAMYGTFVRDMCNALSLVGVDVRVCNPVPQLIWPVNLLGRYRHLSCDPHFVDTIPTVRIKWSTLPYRAFETSLRKRSWSHIQNASMQLFGTVRPQIIHAHDLFPDGFACLKLARHFDSPLVTTSHGSDNRVHIKHSLRKRAVMQAAMQSARVICVSNAVKNELAANSIPLQKLITMHNGVDLNRRYLGPDVDKIRTRFGNRLIILSVGHMVHFVKGFDVTLKAFALLINDNPELKAVVVFVGDGVERKSLEALARELKIEQHVSFEGAKTPEETMKYMAACDVFCLPSWYEAFGIVYLEAMLHDKPVIGVQGQGISEIVKDGNTGLLVPPKNEHATAEALRFMIQNQGRRAEIGMAGGRLVRNQYSWSHWAACMKNVYESILR